MPETADTASSPDLHTGPNQSADLLRCSPALAGQWRLGIVDGPPWALGVEKCEAVGCVQQPGEDGPPLLICVREPASMPPLLRPLSMPWLVLLGITLPPLVRPLSTRPLAAPSMPPRVPPPEEVSACPVRTCLAASSLPLAACALPGLPLLAAGGVRPW